MNRIYTRRKPKMLNEFDFDDSDVVEFFDEKNNIVLKVKYVTDEN
jgi:hypothetical protein